MVFYLLLPFWLSDRGAGNRPFDHGELMPAHSGKMQIFQSATLNSSSPRPETVARYNIISLRHRRKFFLLASAALALWLAPVTIGLPAPARDAIESLEGVRSYSLPNGLRVVLAPNTASRTTTINVCYQIGSRVEADDESGMAHLIEHLMYRGTPTFGSVARELSRRGVEYSGNTTADRTSFVATFAEDDETLRWYLQWQADAMFHSLAPTVDFRAEIGVVHAEMAQTQANHGRLLIQTAMAAMYGPHGYGKPTLGLQSELDTFDLNRLRAFYRRFYRPGNATIVVTGGFDSHRVSRWIRDAFGSLHSGAPPKVAATTVEAPGTGERTVVVRRSGGMPMVAVGFYTPSPRDPATGAAILTAAILGDPSQGRLSRHLKNAFGFNLLLRDSAVMFVGGTLQSEQQVEGVLRVLDDLASDKVTLEEVDSAKARWLGAWQYDFRQPERLATQLGDASARGNWKSFFELRDRIRSTTLSEINEFAATHLTAAHRTVAVFLPAEVP
jgi:zinc protease